MQRTNQCNDSKQKKTMTEHTSYLSFPLHRQDFQIQNFTPKNNYNLPPKRVKYVFFAFNLEKFTPDRIFYTGSARGARDKYEVWL